MKVYPKRRCVYCGKMISTAGVSWGPHRSSCHRKTMAKAAKERAKEQSAASGATLSTKEKS